MIEEDESIDNNDNHSFSSRNTSPTCDKGISSLEDGIIENHDNVEKSSSINSPTLEDIMAQENEIIDIPNKFLT
jgi:hypothetical protein